MIYAGVELGGTKCVAALGNDAGEILAREIVPTTTPDETLGLLEETLLNWQRDQQVETLGIASFGPVDVDVSSATYGHILGTPKPGWSGIGVGPRLANALGVPLAFDTDVNGAALAEMRWGSGQGFADFAYVTVGTGVGVGLIINGRPTRGFGHCELGHLRVSRLADDDWAGACPFHGDCVEGLASGAALKARLGDRLDEIADDDPVWEPVAWTLAQLCHAIVLAAAPMKIAIGGGVMQAQPQLPGRIQSMLVESLNGYLRLPDGPFVVAPELGKDAGPLGAIALAMGARA